MVSSTPSSTADDESPYPLLPKKTWEWLVFIVATILWWGYIGLDPYMQTMIGLGGPDASIRVRGRLPIYFTLGLIFGVPILALAGIRGIAYLLEQREIAKRQAERAARSAKSKTPKAKFN